MAMQVHEAGDEDMAIEVQLMPRLAVVAGFEIGSGSAINTVLPAEAARRLQTLRTGPP